MVIRQVPPRPTVSAVVLPYGSPLTFTEVRAPQAPVIGRPSVGCAPGQIRHPPPFRSRGLWLFRHGLMLSQLAQLRAARRVDGETMCAWCWKRSAVRWSSTVAGCDRTSSSSRPRATSLSVRRHRRGDPKRVDYDELTPDLIGLHRTRRRPGEARLEPTTEMPLHWRCTSRPMRDPWCIPIRPPLRQLDQVDELPSIPI